MAQVMDYPDARVIERDEVRRQTRRSKYAGWAEDAMLRLEQTDRGQAIAYEFAPDADVRRMTDDLITYIYRTHGPGVVRTRVAKQIVYISRGPKWSERFHWMDGS